MSTQPHITAESESQPTVETADSFDSRNAPRMFEPFNTRPCPNLFEDRWQDTSDRPARN